MTRDSESCPCGGHELRAVAEVGDWIHGIPGSPSVREWAARSATWTEGRCEVPREELRSRIKAAGGIACEYALEACASASGMPYLVNGVHRWAIANELKIMKVPVRMIYDTQDAASAWAL
ncbi:ParB N-terminal domain-containing protein [Actinomadura sp. HBU206391]|uniref:ParB N-terminal domain-containing protein n=1 Tax=Actinomadura sp. HBU206391 TaxID=2731692 RepID=UPI0016509EDA|nr:ParB N-terminal domain-containing protein [Actinomadura sp. HBU206391]MBC6463344.1 ParB N-terminal domain-containing protein [Actinomadura sp. HBU206391]